MARIVFCQRLKKNAEGMDFQLYPGELGEYIFANISKEAWAQWQAKQTMLINEKKLNMMEQDHRKMLEDEMVKYLIQGQDIDIEGYIPPSKK